MAEPEPLSPTPPLPVVRPKSCPVSDFVPFPQQEGTTNFLNVTIPEDSFLSLIPHRDNQLNDLPDFSIGMMCYLIMKEDFVVNFKLVEPLTDKQCLIVGFELECTNPEQQQKLDNWRLYESDESPIELVRNSVFARTVVASSQKFEFPWIYTTGDEQCLTFRFNYCNSKKDYFPLRFRVTTQLYSYPSKSYTAEGVLICPVYVNQTTKNHKGFLTEKYGMIMDPYRFGQKHSFTEFHLLPWPPVRSDDSEQPSLERVNSVEARAVLPSKTTKIRNRPFPWLKVVPNDSMCIVSLGKHFFGTGEFDKLLCKPKTESVMAKDGWSVTTTEHKDGQCTLTLKKCTIIRAPSDNAENTAEAFRVVSQTESPAQHRLEASCSSTTYSQSVSQANGLEQSQGSTLIPHAAQGSSQPHTCKKRSNQGYLDHQMSQQSHPSTSGASSQQNENSSTVGSMSDCAAQQQSTDLLPSAANVQLAQPEVQATVKEPMLRADTNPKTTQVSLSNFHQNQASTAATTTTTTSQPTQSPESNTSSAQASEIPLPTEATVQPPVLIPNEVTRQNVSTDETIDQNTSQPSSNSISTGTNSQKWNPQDIRVLRHIKFVLRNPTGNVYQMGTNDLRSYDPHYLVALLYRSGADDDLVKSAIEVFPDIFKNGQLVDRKWVETPSQAEPQLGNEQQQQQLQRQGTREKLIAFLSSNHAAANTAESQSSPIPQTAQTAYQANVASAQRNQLDSNTATPSQQSTNDRSQFVQSTNQSSPPVNGQTHQSVIRKASSTARDRSPPNVNASSHTFNSAPAQTVNHVPVPTAQVRVQNGQPPAQANMPLTAAAALPQLAQSQSPVISAHQYPTASRHSMPQLPNSPINLATHPERISSSSHRSPPQPLSHTSIAAQSSNVRVTSANPNPAVTPVSVHSNSSTARAQPQLAQPNLVASAALYQTPNRVSGHTPQSNHPTNVTSEPVQLNNHRLSSNSLQMVSTANQSPSNNGPMAIAQPRHTSNHQTSHSMPFGYVPQTGPFSQEEIDEQYQLALRQARQQSANPAHPYAYPPPPSSSVSNGNHVHSVRGPRECHGQLSSVPAPMMANQAFARQPNQAPRSMRPQQQQQTNNPRGNQNRMPPCSMPSQQYCSQEYYSNSFNGSTNQLGSQQSAHFHGRGNGAQHPNRAPLMQGSGCTVPQRYPGSQSNQAGLYQSSQHSSSSIMNQNMLNSQLMNPSQQQMYSTGNNTARQPNANHYHMALIPQESRMHGPRSEYGNVRTTYPSQVVPNQRGTVDYYASLHGQVQLSSSTASTGTIMTTQPHVQSRPHDQMATYRKILPAPPVNSSSSAPANHPTAVAYSQQSVQTTYGVNGQMQHHQQQRTNVSAWQPQQQQQQPQSHTVANYPYNHNQMANPQYSVVLSQSSNLVISTPNHNGQPPLANAQSVSQSKANQLMCNGQSGQQLSNINLVQGRLTASQIGLQMAQVPNCFHPASIQAAGVQLPLINSQAPKPSPQQPFYVMGGLAASSVQANFATNGVAAQQQNKTLAQSKDPHPMATNQQSRTNEIPNQMTTSNTTTLSQMTPEQLETVGRIQLAQLNQEAMQRARQAAINQSIIPNLASIESPPIPTESVHKQSTPGQTQAVNHGTQVASAMVQMKSVHSGQTTSNPLATSQPPQVFFSDPSSVQTPGAQAKQPQRISTSNLSRSHSQPTLPQIVTSPQLAQPHEQVTCAHQNKRATRHSMPNQSNGSNNLAINPTRISPSNDIDQSHANSTQSLSNPLNAIANQQSSNGQLSLAHPIPTTNTVLSSEPNLDPSTPAGTCQTQSEQQAQVQQEQEKPKSVQRRKKARNVKTGKAQSKHPLPTKQKPNDTDIVQTGNLSSMANDNAGPRPRAQSNPPIAHPTISAPVPSVYSNEPGQQQFYFHPIEDISPNQQQQAELPTLPCLKYVPCNNLILKYLKEIIRYENPTFCIYRIGKYAYDLRNQSPEKLLGLLFENHLDLSTIEKIIETFKEIFKDGHREGKMWIRDNAALPHSSENAVPSGLGTSTQSGEATNPVTMACSVSRNVTQSSSNPSQPLCLMTSGHPNSNVTPYASVQSTLASSSSAHVAQSHQHQINTSIASRGNTSNPIATGTHQSQSLPTLPQPQTVNHVPVASVAQVQVSRAPQNGSSSSVQAAQAHQPHISTSVSSRANTSNSIATRIQPTQSQPTPQLQAVDHVPLVNLAQVQVSTAQPNASSSAQAAQSLQPQISTPSRVNTSNPIAMVTQSTKSLPTHPQPQTVNHVPVASVAQVQVPRAPPNVSSSSVQEVQSHQLQISTSIASLANTSNPIATDIQPTHSLTTPPQPQAVNHVPVAREAQVQVSNARPNASSSSSAHAAPSRQPQISTPSQANHSNPMAIGTQPAKSLPTLPQPQPVNRIPVTNVPQGQMSRVPSNVSSSNPLPSYQPASISTSVNPSHTSQPMSSSTNESQLVQSTNAAPCEPQKQSNASNHTSTSTPVHSQPKTTQPIKQEHFEPLLVPTKTLLDYMNRMLHCPTVNIYKRGGLDLRESFTPESLIESMFKYRFDIGTIEKIVATFDEIFKNGRIHNEMWLRNEVICKRKVKRTNLETPSPIVVQSQQSKNRNFNASQANTSNQIVTDSKPTQSQVSTPTQSSTAADTTMHVTQLFVQQSPANSPSPSTARATPPKVTTRAESATSNSKPNEHSARQQCLLPITTSLVRDSANSCIRSRVASVQCAQQTLAGSSMSSSEPMSNDRLANKNSHNDQPDQRPNETELGVQSSTAQITQHHEPISQTTNSVTDQLPQIANSNRSSTNATIEVPLNITQSNDPDEVDEHMLTFFACIVDWIRTNVEKCEESGNYEDAEPIYIMDGYDLRRKTPFELVKIFNDFRCAIKTMRRATILYKDIFKNGKLVGRRWVPNDENVQIEPIIEPNHAEYNAYPEPSTEPSNAVVDKVLVTTIEPSYEDPFPESCTQPNHAEVNPVVEEPTTPLREMNADPNDLSKWCALGHNQTESLAGKNFFTQLYHKSVVNNVVNHVSAEVSQSRIEQEPSVQYPVQADGLPHKLPQQFTSAALHSTAPPLSQEADLEDSDLDLDKSIKKLCAKVSKRLAVTQPQMNTEEAIEFGQNLSDSNNVLSGLSISMINECPVTVNSFSFLSNASIALSESTQPPAPSIQPNATSSTPQSVASAQSELSTSPTSPTSHPQDDLQQVTDQTATKRRILPKRSCTSKQPKTVKSKRKPNPDLESDSEPETKSTCPSLSPQDASTASGRKRQKGSQNLKQKPKQRLIGLVGTKTNSGAKAKAPPAPPKPKKAVQPKAKEPAQDNTQTRKLLYRVPICICGSRNYIDDTPLLICYGCGVLHHRECVKVPLEQEKEFKKKPRWVFECAKCNKDSPDNSQWYLGPIKSPQLYRCICRMPYNHNKSYVECDRCEKQFHQYCFGMVDKHAKLLPAFFCQPCTQVNIEEGRPKPREDDMEGQKRLEELEAKYGKARLAAIHLREDKKRFQQNQIMTRVPTAADFALFELVMDKLKANAYSKLFHKKIQGDTYLQLYNMTTSKNLHFTSIMEKIQKGKAQLNSNITACTSYLKYNRVGQFVFDVNELFHTARRYTRRLIKTFQEDVQGNILPEKVKEVQELKAMELARLNTHQKEVQKGLHRKPADPTKKKRRKAKRLTMKTQPKYTNLDHLSTAHMMFISRTVTVLQNQFGRYMDTHLRLGVNWPAEFNEDPLTADDTDADEYYIEETVASGSGTSTLANGARQEQHSPTVPVTGQSSANGTVSPVGTIVTTRAESIHQQTRQARQQQSRKRPMDISEIEEQNRKLHRSSGPHKPGSSRG